MSEPGQGPTRAPRIPFAREVEVRFEEFDQFVTEYSKDLSLTGMFLRTRHPHPPGSSFQFEFQIEGGQPLIRGVGEVVWIRSAEQSGDEPPGMGIRFISLDANGQRLVRWLIERNLARGAPSFELGGRARESAEKPS